MQVRAPTSRERLLWAEFGDPLLPTPFSRSLKLLSAAMEGPGTAGQVCGDSQAWRRICATPPTPPLSQNSFLFLRNPPLSLLLPPPPASLFLSVLLRFVVIEGGAATWGECLCSSSFHVAPAPCVSCCVPGLGFQSRSLSRRGRGKT